MEPQDQFSERERKVIEALLQGKSNKQIAATLGLSLRTVEFHLSNIYKKLGVTSRIEAALKLSEEHLRESALETNDALRKSTVEKAGEIIENGENPVQLRRQKMKNLVYILMSGVVLILIIGVSLFGKQVPNLFTQELQASATPEIAKATETLIVTPTRLPTETPTLSYQVLSPTKIEKGNSTFEASAVLMSCAELQFEVIGTFSSEYPTPSAGNDYPFIVMQDGVKLSSNDVSLTPDLHYGGGGGIDESNFHVRSNGAGYFINPPLTSGQKLHLVALVNLNEVFGITNPVRFELDLTAGQCQ
ncbi:MAG TPA: response regulator transcription factor [Anaerolineales bacterium]